MSEQPACHQFDRRNPLNQRRDRRFGVEQYTGLCNSGRRLCLILRLSAGYDRTVPANEPVRVFETTNGWALISEENGRSLWWPRAKDGIAPGVQT
jgi:hypothetical protein